MEKVKIKVDLENRNKLRRLHTATHILNYSARKVLGNHVWQNGSNLKPEYGTLDITHYNNINSQEVFKIERLVNEIIFENKKVYVEELDRGEAEKKYGFVLYQGGAIPMKKLRVVKIENSDIEACGGIHMLKIGGIGIFKIVETNKIQDGVVRIKFVVRNYAFNLIEENKNLLNEICNVFSVDKNSIVRTGEKFFDEWKKQKKEIDNLKKSLKALYILSILNSKLNEFDLKSDFDMGFLMEIFNQVISKKNDFKLISKKFIIATPNFKVENFKKIIDKKKFKIYVI